MKVFIHRYDSISSLFTCGVWEIKGVVQYGSTLSYKYPGDLCDWCGLLKMNMRVAPKMEFQDVEDVVAEVSESELFDSAKN